MSSCVRNLTVLNQLVISLRFQELHNFYELLTTSSKNGLNYHETYCIVDTVYIIYSIYSTRQLQKINLFVLYRYVMITLDYDIQMGAIVHNMYYISFICNIICIQ